MSRIYKFTRKQKIMTIAGAGIILATLIGLLVLFFCRNNEPRLSIVVPENWTKTCQKDDDYENCTLENSILYDEKVYFQKINNVVEDSAECNSQEIVVHVKITDLEHTEKLKLAEIIIYDKSKDYFMPQIRTIHSDVIIHENQSVCEIKLSDIKYKNEVIAVILSDTWLNNRELTPDEIDQDPINNSGQSGVRLIGGAEPAFFESKSAAKKALETEGYSIAVKIISDSVRD